ncbi:MAG: hypothetical protein KA807_11275 [Prolixibacteraceae bacterium]|nr:hypothetical protein [Prolixibacteraceae bacterium]
MKTNQNISKHFSVTCLMFLFSTFIGVDAKCQNDIVLINKKNKKEFILPKEHHQLYLKVIPANKIFDKVKMPPIQAKEFPIDSGYIGTPYEYRGITFDSITLQLPNYWENSIKKYQMQFRIPLSDVSEICVQRTYNKTTEQVWIWGGVLGVVGLIAGPSYYFTDHKALGIGWFALGISSITASVISYKIHFGYDKYKRLYFNILVK